MAPEIILWHTLPLKKVFFHLSAQPSGLSTAQAQERLKKYGPNKLPEERRLSGAAIFLTQFKSPLVYVLLAAATITTILQDFSDTIIILAAVIINVLLGFYQENKANRAISHLRKLIDLQTKVLRDGNEITLSTSQLVPGDVIFLSPGDKIPADARIISQKNLELIEAALTGESSPSEKKEGALEPGTTLADRENMIYSGTVVARGRATAVVITTGLETEIGKISALLRTTKEEPTPLQLQIAGLSRLFTLGIGAIVLLILLVGWLQGLPILEFGDNTRESILLIAVAVAVSAIPEGLIIVVTVILSVGMQAILKQKALVRRLIAAETLGSVSIICTDKTGTLTTGVMEVDRIITYSEDIVIKHPASYQPSEVLKDHDLITKISVLCSNAVIENPDAELEKFKVIGDPTERALLLAALQRGIQKREMEQDQPRLAEIPFDAEKKYMATLHKLDNKQNVVYLKGAPDRVLPLATKVRINGEKVTLTAAKRQELTKKFETLTERGLRLLAFAYKKIDKNQEINLAGELNGLVFVGFIALKDPLRPEAKSALQLTRQAGIRTIIVTGDHKLTARAISQEIGFGAKEKNILEGYQLDELSDQQFSKILAKIDIYARVEPRHKLRIITAWQRRGEVVAMTGDGVNDAPALKAADIGVALGSGTDVAKETSDVILLDNNFKTIVAAVHHGRIIFDNIRKVLFYLLSDSFSSTILVIGAMALKFPLPLLPAQILWVNIINDGFPALSLTAEPGEKDVMQFKPRPKHDKILNGELKAIIFIVGVVLDFFVLLAFWYLMKFTSYSLEHIRTIIFSIIALDSLLYIFSCRSLRNSIFSISFFSNPLLLAAVVGSFILQLLAIYAPPMQVIMGTMPLTSFRDWTLILSLGFIKIFAFEITKYLFSRSTAQLKQIPTSSTKDNFVV